jgi:hypothetical protein
VIIDLKGGYPYPSGSGWYVSEEIKSDFFVFCYVTVKVQKNVLKREKMFANGEKIFIDIIWPVSMIILSLFKVFIGY